MNLVEGPTSRKHPERMHERFVSRSRQGPSDAHHVRLGHAAMDEPLRDGVLEQVDLALAGEVTGEANDVLALAG
jgi:hypothetical protein